MLHMPLTSVNNDIRTDENLDRWRAKPYYILGENVLTSMLVRAILLRT
jgi:hypothetical protein